VIACARAFDSRVCSAALPPCDVHHGQQIQLVVRCRSSSSGVSHNLVFFFFCLDSIVEFVPGEIGGLQLVRVEEGTLHRLPEQKVRQWYMR
jgi:hypothetical protein